MIHLTETSPGDDLPLPPRKKLMNSSPYNNHQLDLFQTFLCNPNERQKLSNTIDIWDSIPRYSISRQEQNKRRDANGGLPILAIQFEYRGQPYIAKIQPARIEEPDGTTRDYYPSASEELVEDALRKIALRQNQGFFEKDKYRSGVAFSLYELREELSSRGHTRSYQQIIQSLTILQRSHIELRVGEGRGEAFLAANYLPTLSAVSRKRLIEDPGARWIAQFHPLVAKSIDQVTYRQYNYEVMMSLPTQLARWLHKQLSIKFTFAGLASKPFEMRYSTIKRDSNLLNRGREVDNRRDVDEAFAELVKMKVLREIEKTNITQGKGKVAEVVYQLFPSLEFVKEMKASNKRALNSKPASRGSLRPE